MSYTYTPYPNVTINSTTGTGAYLVSNGSSSNLTWATTTVDGSTNLTPKTLQVSGDADFKGDVTVQGISLMETLISIEQRLAILHPNPELEEKWEQLKGLRQMYMELEAEIIEKEKMWAILKR